MGEFEHFQNIADICMAGGSKTFSDTSVENIWVTADGFSNSFYQVLDVHISTCAAVGNDTTRHDRASKLKEFFLTISGPTLHTF